MLERHPQSAAGAVRRIEVRVRRDADAIDVSYAIEGELERIAVPPVRAARAAHRLWEHTCCELFVARKGEPGYEELNFSPSGEWARYAFSGYREAGPALNGVPPRITVRRDANRLVLEARAAMKIDGAIIVGVSAVVEEREGPSALSYWALRHAPGKPDFHHRDAFAMELDEVRH